jgi:hypothetical protein
MICKKARGEIDHTTEGAMNPALRMPAAIGVGAGVMYVLDPEGGRRRRAVARDRMRSVVARTGDAVDVTSRDMRNRAQGVVAEIRSLLRDDGRTSDDVLLQRVRSRIGEITGRSSAIDVTVSDGRVTLRGPVLRSEVDRLLARVRGVRGVRQVESELEIHAEPGHVPALQGRPRPPRGGEVFELMQNNWAPAPRFLVGLGGAAGVLWGLGRADLVGAAAALAGATLLARSVTNRPLTNLLGVRTRRRGAVAVSG